MTLEKLVAGRSDPPRADRGGPRAVDGGDGGTDPSRRGGRRRRGRHHRHPPGDGEAARTPAVPDELRPERPASTWWSPPTSPRPSPPSWGWSPTIAKRGAFLHDIGKAVTHEVEGSHAIIGAEIARRMKEEPEVVHCIESHHGEVEQRTIDAVLAQIADSISGGRPGARRESIETYVKRLERLEEICTAFEGVEKVYAMQAGREVRVLVQPEAGRRPGGAGDRTRHREAGRGGTPVPGADPDHGGPRDARHRVRALSRRGVLGAWGSLGDGAALPDPHLRVPDERARFRADRRRAGRRRDGADPGPRRRAGDRAQHLCDPRERRQQALRQPRAT